MLNILYSANFTKFTKKKNLAKHTEEMLLPADIFISVSQPTLIVYIFGQYMAVRYVLN